MEKIIRIQESTPIVFDDDDGRRGQFDGYEITTTRQVIKIGVSNDQACCESWGYLMSEDDTKDFVGADLLDVKIVDTALNVKCMTEVEEGGIMFVNLYTSVGLLQLSVYNSHNGYYGHTAMILSEQITHTQGV